VTAIVVADDSVTAEDVERVVRGRLADYKIPRRVDFVDELPKTSTRKIDKVALRERY
jgi:acyl-CoA synthetase (AMP-forming)/AMP-acid ligase II